MPPSFFADAALVRRIEDAEARLAEAGGRAAQRRRDDALVTPVSGGVAVFTGDASPFDKVAGLGFEPFDEAAFARHEATVLARGGAVQVELSTRADPNVAQTLSTRGYVLTAFEDVLALRLATATDARSAPDAIDVRPAAPNEIDTWIDTLLTGFAHADDQGVASHESFPRDAVARAMCDLLSTPGTTPYLARRDGVVVGGASVRVCGTVAQLAGAATLPAHRRRGVQAALTEARLADAARAGAEIATITTLPGSKSQENALRRGFSVLYTRAVLIKAVATPGG